MAVLDDQEILMFSKWHGTCNLHINEDFWNDCLKYYEDKTVTLPIEYNTESVNCLCSKVICLPGQCGDCCHWYPKVRMTDEEYQKIIDFTHEDFKGLIEEDNVKFIDTSHGCPYQKDTICSIYEVRPETCKLYPVLKPVDSVRKDGTVFKQIQMRLRCKPSLDVIKEIIIRCCTEQGYILLPDLTLINEKGDVATDIIAIK